MDVVVLISGIADPKWPLPKTPSIASLQIHLDRYGVLSPFDEAALQLALNLRDADPSARVVALVAADQALTRRVAGWRPDEIHRLDLAAIRRWDGGALSRALSQALLELAPAASLVLMGREFGDYDDGSVPAGLAQVAGLPYFPLVLGLQRGDPGFSALRQAATGLERVGLPDRALLSVTNDNGNRLRHPLMKNVMMVRKALLPDWRAPGALGGGGLHLQAVRPATEPARRSGCEWLRGSPEQKAGALAQLLLAEIRP